MAPTLPIDVQLLSWIGMVVVITFPYGFGAQNLVVVGVRNAGAGSKDNVPKGK